MNGQAIEEQGCGKHDPFPRGLLPFHRKLVSHLVVPVSAGKIYHATSSPEAPSEADQGLGDAICEATPHVILPAMGTLLPAPGSARAWLLASRPATLTAAVVPVFVGAACAEAQEGFHFWTSLACLACAIFIQVGTNFANDVFDFEKGADTQDRLGPVRAVQAGLLTPSQVRKGMWLAFGLTGLCALYLAAIGGWPLLGLGVLAIASGIAYTGGPYPLGYNGLGDLFVIAFFGFVAVAGTAYVNLLTVPEIAWWSAIPVGFLATAILVVNNLRDLPTDAASGKRTLAVRFGRRAALLEYGALLLVSYAIPGVLHARGLAGPWIYLPWLTAPMAVRLASQIQQRQGRDLNAVLIATARLLLAYGLMFTVGILLG